MKIVLLSGGSGLRLFPLSNEVRSKQFIKFFSKQNSNENDRESMLQRVFRQIRSVFGDVDITIATSRSQVSTIKNQLGDELSISIEPSRRDTFPAIFLAAMYLKDVKRVSSDEKIIVCPIDPYVDEKFFAALKNLETICDDGIALFGIEPTYPSAKYGYIIPENSEQISSVKMFREKPDEKTAEEFIKTGALWNAGVFAFKLGWLLSKIDLPFKNYDEVLKNYDQLPKISFDYAVVEKEKSIRVLKFAGEWKDLGTWNTLTEALDSNKIGNAVIDSSCENVHVINELSSPILCMGLKNIIVAASANGILVSDKKSSSYIKKHVEKFDRKIKFAEKSWGSYEVIDVDESSLTIKVTLLPGHSMHYHSHEFRSEVWNVISGTGVCILDGVSKRVFPGDIIEIPIGCRHTIRADDDSSLKIIEVQFGDDISVNDKIKHDPPN